MGLALQEGGFGGSVVGLGGGVAEVRRQRDAQRLEELAGRAGGRGTENEPFAVLLDLDLLETIQVAQDVGPFEVEAGCRQAIAERLLQHQGEERTEHVAADGRVAFVEDRPGRQQGFGASEQLLDPLQLAVAQHRLEGVERGVGA